MTAKKKTSKKESTDIDNKPDFADKKTWKAYLILEIVAKERKYRKIGVRYATDLISGSFGLTNRTATTVRDIFYRLAKPPYKWIEVGGGQIIVKPKSEVLKKYSGGANDN